ncbi:MAG: CDP-alcohol phosphatidyltransferase family protein [Marinirhabdus sp.]
MGLQLDSLADMVTSGVAPAMVMVQLLAVSLTGATLQPQSLNFPQGWGIGWQSFLPFAGLFIAVAAGHRLAKFNVDTRQTTHFIGVPTPAIALLVLSFPLILEFQYTKMVATVILNPWFLLATTLLCGILMNVEMPLFALKFKTWGFKPNRVRYIFLVLSAVALFVFHFLAIPLLILSYILLSLFWREGERSLKL